MVEVLNFDNEPKAPRRMGNKSTEEIAVRVVTWLRRLGELCDEELPVPVLKQGLALQVQRDVEYIVFTRSIGSDNVIEEPYCQVRTMKRHSDPAMEDAFAACGEVVLDPAERLAVGKPRTSPDPKLGLPPFLRLKQLVRAHDGLEEVDSSRIREACPVTRIGVVNPGWFSTPRCRWR